MVVDQSIEWLDQVQLDVAYLAMFPVRRELDRMVRILTDSALRQESGVFQSIGDTNFDRLRTDDDSLTIWGSQSGFTAEISSQSMHSNCPDDELWITNNSELQQGVFSGVFRWIHN